VIDTNLESERKGEQAAGATNLEAPAEGHGQPTQFVSSGQHLPAVAAEAKPAAASASASDRAYGNLDEVALVKNAAQRAASRVIAEHGEAPRAGGVAEQGGHAVGVALGVIVTEALAALPSWNQPVVDANGAQVEQVPGATRIGNHPIRKRHEEVVGPKIAAAVERMSPGVIRDLLEGVGIGATEAPGDSYRLEAHLADLIRRHVK
jgi:hypothetical protein